jgi:opacity protein-like surface antigen
MIVTRTLVLVLAIGLASTAEAQTRTQPRTPARTPPPPPQQQGLGFRGYATFGSTTLAAKETFDAVAGTDSATTFGGGVQVTNIWKGVFVDFGVSQLSLDGSRVIVVDDEVFDLGIPLDVKMRPIDVAGGWRFNLMRGRVSPYAGAGFSYLLYEETSDFADADENVDESKVGPFVIGGVDVQLWKWIHAGGEFRWRSVTGILGEGGASAEFDEDDAGGFSAAVRISIGR